MEITANTQERKAMTVIKAQTTKITNQFETLVIKNQKDLGAATEALIKINDFEKEVKAQEDAIVKPIKEGIKKAQEFFKPLREKIAFLKGELKMKMVDYDDLLEVEKKKKAKEMEEAINEGKISLGKAGKVLEKLEMKSNSISTRIHRVIKVTNKKIVPKKYWVLDMVALRKDALAGIKIKGVKVVEEKIIVTPPNNYGK